MAMCLLWIINLTWSTIYSEIDGSNCVPAQTVITLFDVFLMCSCKPVF